MFEGCVYVEGLTFEDAGERSELAWEPTRPAAGCCR